MSQSKMATRITEEVSTDELADGIVDNLTRVLDKVAPKQVRKCNRDKTWWTNSLSTKRKILKNLYKKKHLHEKLQKKYQELKADFSREIRKAKVESWRDFCSTAESTKDLSSLIQILDNNPKKQMSLLTAGGSTLDPQRSLELLLQTHFPDGQLCEGGKAI